MQNDFDNKRCSGVVCRMKRRIFLCLILMFLLPVVAQADSMIIRPEADAGTNMWTAVNCVDHYDCVNEVTANDDDHLYECHTDNGYDEWTLEDVSGTIPAEATIDSLTAFCRIKTDVFQNFHIAIRIVFSKTDGTTRTPGDSWTEYTEKLDAPGGRSWSRANLDSLKMTPQMEEEWCPSYNCYISQAYCTVYYTTEEPPAAGQVIIIGAKDEENYHNPRFVCPDLGR